MCLLSFVKIRFARRAIFGSSHFFYESCALGHWVLERAGPPSCSQNAVLVTASGFQQSWPFRATRRVTEVLIPSSPRDAGCGSTQSTTVRAFILTLATTRQNKLSTRMSVGATFRVARYVAGVLFSLWPIRRVDIVQIDGKGGDEMADNDECDRCDPWDNLKGTSYGCVVHPEWKSS